MIIEGIGIVVEEHWW